MLLESSHTESLLVLVIVQGLLKGKGLLLNLSQCNETVTLACVDRSAQDLSIRLVVFVCRLINQSESSELARDANVFIAEQRKLQVLLALAYFLGRVDHSSEVVCAKAVRSLDHHLQGCFLLRWGKEVGVFGELLEALELLVPVAFRQEVVNLGDEQGGGLRVLGRVKISTLRRLLLVSLF